MKDKKVSIKIPNFGQCLSKGAHLTVWEYQKQGEIFFDWFKKFSYRSETMYYDGIGKVGIIFKKMTRCGPNGEGLSLQFRTKLASYNLLIKDGKISFCYVSDKPSGKEYIITECPSKLQFEREFMKYIKSAEYKELIKKYDDAFEAKKNKKRKK